MAILKAFKGIRPVKEKAHSIASRPYDVLNKEEARIESAYNKYSYLHVVKPEIDLPDDWMWIADMINEDGRDMSITVPGGPIDPNEPWRGNSPGTPISAKGIFVGHTADHISGDHVKRQEQRLLVAPASNVIISEGTKIVDSIDGSDWYVEKFRKITEETNILLYILEVRQ